MTVATRMIMQANISYLKTGILHSYLAANGAEVVRRQDMLHRSQEGTPLAIVVPHDIAAEDLQKLRSESFVSSSDEFVTDLWVERCLHTKTSEPTDFVLCRPLTRFPINGEYGNYSFYTILISHMIGFEKLVICPTAFSGIDLLHFSKITKLMGKKSMF